MGLGLGLGWVIILLDYSTVFYVCEYFYFIVVFIHMLVYEKILLIDLRLIEIDDDDFDDVIIF